MAASELSSIVALSIIYSCSHAADPADSSSFFDDLASQIPQSPTAKGASPAPSPRGPAPGGLHADEAEAQPGTAEASILRALYAANYSAAVDACLQVETGHYNLPFEPQLLVLYHSQVL